jgi:cytochrome c553
MRYLWACFALLALLALAATSVQAADVSAGKAIYERLCVPCHGPNGVGATGPAMNTVAFGQKYNTAAKLRDVTRRGAPGMPAYGPELLTDADLEELVAYINSLVPPGYVTPGVEPTPFQLAQAAVPTAEIAAQTAAQTEAKQSLSLAQMYALLVIVLAGVMGLGLGIVWIRVDRGPP